MERLETQAATLSVRVETVLLLARFLHRQAVALVVYMVEAAVRRDHSRVQPEPAAQVPRDMSTSLGNSK